MLATPHLQLVLLRKVAADFRQAQSRIMMLGQGNIFHRVAAFLVDMMAIAQFFRRGAIAALSADEPL